MMIVHFVARCMDEESDGLWAWMEIMVQVMFPQLDNASAQEKSTQEGTDSKKRKDRMNKKQFVGRNRS